MRDYPAEVDNREAKGLWGPGNYWCLCFYCKVDYFGHKRSHSCADCAYKDERIELSDSGPVECELYRENCRSTTSLANTLSDEEANRMSQEEWENFWKDA